MSLWLSLSQCGYTSYYSPPSDGRARLVVVDYLPVMKIAGIKLGSVCQRAIEQRLQNPPKPVLGFYRPRIFFKDPKQSYPIKIGQTYYRLGQAYFASHLALAPSPDHLTDQTLSTDLSSENRNSMYALLNRLNMLGVFGRLWDLGALSARDELSLSITTGWLAISELLLVAAPWFPVMLLTSAWQQPGFWHTTASAVDKMNAYNDLARRPGNPCSYEGIGE